MGEYRDASGVRHYTPDNDKNTLYLRASDYIYASYLMEMIEKHFGDVDLNDVTISSMQINTRHIDYDLYDSADWDDFIVVEYFPKG